MQKDLLAELHLPELDLKNLESIVTQNSKRLACVIKENNEYIKKSKVIPPSFKVVMGGRLLDIDVKFPVSVSAENIKTVKQKFIVKKGFCHSEISVRNKLETSPHRTVKNSSTDAHNTSQDSITEDNDKANCTEIRPLFTKKGSNSIISPTASTLEPCRMFVSDTGQLLDTTTSSFIDKDPEVQILLDKSANKRSDTSLSLDSHRSLLKPEVKIKKPIVIPNENAVTSSTGIDVEGYKTIPKLKENSDTTMCVISEVIGNAHTTFSVGDDPQENVDETQEGQLITPQKTNDITKIKGWRRKQFFVEKPTTVEFYSFPKGSRNPKKKIELISSAHFKEMYEEPGNKENAFVCDSLDEFLEQEADLKIGYEVPHLYAEIGIKLTSDEIVSRPSLSEKDLKEVEMRYCMPVSLFSDNINLDDISEEDVKGVKRLSEDDTKSCKSLKLDESRSIPVKILQKQREKKTKSILKANCLTAESTTQYLSKNESQLCRSPKDFSNFKLLSKLIALVIYPGPFKPLHPIVRYHLNKLRSFRTVVDENWASFAASAVIVKDRRCKRRLLPAYCCVKTEVKPKNEAVVKAVMKKDNEKQTQLKECHVVIKRLQPSQISDPWCMEHNCYNCSLCGLARLDTSETWSLTCPVPKSHKSIKSSEQEEEQGETVTVSPRASFNKKIARLLAKKVRLLKANGDTLRSIDSLRIIKNDTIEFIKLKFVKESFLAGYINIWYLKPETAAVRSRAFLTFSQSSPVPNAINLKSTGLSLINLPKVITEIVSTENMFDSNEYAILHCNNGNWEIHGSLNITFGNSDKYVEQIFTSLELPELKKLQEIAEKILHVKSVKWWVLDLTQRFKLIELRSGNFSTVVTRKRFLELIKLNSFGFISLRKDLDNRVLGAYIIQRLLPFVLIGPYYLLETRDMILKGVSSTVPFQYYGEDAVTTNYPLKFFINSVIKNLEGRNNKKLEGLWLYDKMCLDRTSYIEVVTTDLENQSLDKCSVIDIDHGYSLNSLTHSSPSGATSGIVKRKDGKHELQTVTVYLYFDIFELGFVEGELQFDNSVIINHPLDERTKMKSHKIGDWFISIIRRKVVFIPDDLPVKWFITKYKDDLRDRNPFNRFILGGAHIITERGVFYLLELSESKIERLGLDKNEIVKVMSQCEVLKEVRELKNLAKLLLSDTDKSLSMEGVLTKAVKEIKTLKERARDLEFEKALAETKKLKLAYSFLKLVNSFNIRGHFKLKMIENIEDLFRLKNGKLNEEFVKSLKQSRIGLHYLKQLGRNGGNLNAAETDEDDLTSRISELLKVDKLGTSKSAAVELLICTLQRLSNKKRLIKKPSVKNLNSYSNAFEMNGTPKGYQLQDTKLTSTSEEFSSFTFTRRKVLKSGSPVKEVESKQKKSTGTIVISKSENNSNRKADGFRLSASEIPSNIKLCLKNWNVNKVEVS